MGFCEEYLCWYELGYENSSLLGWIMCHIVILISFCALLDDVVHPRVLLTHIPLYRRDDTYCGPHRSSPIINQVNINSVS